MIRLTSFAMLTDRELTRRLTRFLGRLRYRVACEYLLVNEWRGGQRHVHVLIRASGVIRPEVVSALWAKINPGPRSIRSSYCRQVRNPIGAARYIVKHVRDEAKKEVAPRTYPGRVMTYSKGFLSQSLDTLWREQLREWTARRGRRP
jgi:hypothetical protein